MDELELKTPPSPGQWIEGAKALAQFQALITGAGQGETITGGPREGKTYTSLLDITKAVQAATQFGLSHSFSCHGFGDFSSFMYRCTLHHISGESKYSEIPVSMPKGNNYTMREQELGGIMTYRKKYLLTGLYGIASDPALDPDRQSFSDQDIALQQSELAKPVIKVQTQQAVAPKPQPESDPSTEPLTPQEHTEAINIIKGSPEAKAEFLQAFYPDMTRKLNTDDIKLKGHLQFLKDSIEIINGIVPSTAQNI